MAFGRNGEGNGMQATGPGRTWTADRTETLSGRRGGGAKVGTGQRPLVFDDRSDLPEGLVLYAYDGRLSVADRAGREHAGLAYRRDRWVWRAEGDAGYQGIAPDPAEAWRAILEVLWNGQPTP